ncbi:hypothetical protein LOTGIDRAFT_218109 [Lottia gigantea]|uniref:Uncharacterized protein n=1 Tax=Lottia gigantea TaxID=225164 RepID=V4A9U5_LOTGI|nr:hypothetical protein LOTGIDRAFT_218109 [Lottia gigantea]ESO90066.1 hypothetical protein LOTGIDRAFT_218109 [Lottia gigantea]
MATGNSNIDKKLALATVYLNSGAFEKAITIYTEILNKKPKIVAAYYGRGVAFTRKGLYVTENAIQALADFTQAIQKDKRKPDSYERRAEVYISLGQYQEAFNDLTTALQKRPTEKIYFMRGVISLLLEDFGSAEEDFRRNLESEGDIHIMSYFHLGLALYYRGKVRNAIEVFKEVLKLKPDHIDACTSLAQAFRELGNLKAANTRFNQSLMMNPEHILSIQLHGSMLYNSGQPVQALHDFQKCIKLDTNNIHCQYMEALSYMTLGKFYEGVKASAKVIVKNITPIKMTSEFLKAQYLKEYGRYLHSKLETQLKHFKPESDLDPEFKENWIKNLPFKFKKSYKEQPGLQPEISDIKEHNISDYTADVRNLICKAVKVGSYTQVNTDGFTPNNRLNLAMGLASLHIAQYLEKKWKSLKNGKERLDWQDLFNIAVQYRRLVDPEQPVFWVDTMPEFRTTDGVRSDINFVRGSVLNLRVMQYYDLVFKLAKTMLEHYTGDEAIVYSGLHEDVSSAKTCDDLLMIARKRQINPHGFLVSTQVPSTSKSKEDKRLDGSILVLSKDMNDRVIFALNTANNVGRMEDYSLELDFIFNQLQEEMKRTGSNKITDVDSILNMVLSLMYYFYNLVPLTRGSSVVAYTVGLGIMMSVGRQVTGKIPSGKLLDLEAMLAGAPDAFILVTKQWMNIKKNSTSTLSYPRVSEVFPTVRSILEVLTVHTTACS